MNDNFVFAFRVVVGSWLFLLLAGLLLIFPGPVKEKPKRIHGTVTTGESVLSQNQTRINKTMSSELEKSNRQAAEELKGKLTSSYKNVKAEYEGELTSELDGLQVTKSEATVQRMILSQPFIMLYVMNMLSVMSGYFAVNNFH